MNVWRQKTSDAPNRGKESLVKVWIRTSSTTSAVDTDEMASEKQATTRITCHDAHTPEQMTEEDIQCFRMLEFQLATQLPTNFS